jgi:nitronate monooxygenase
MRASMLGTNGSSLITSNSALIPLHRCRLLTDNLAAQVGTFALVPQIADAVKLPVIAAGGVTNARGIAAAFALGASGAQLGTAFLFCPESKVLGLHRAALRTARDNETVLTNVMTGRAARGFINRAGQSVGNDAIDLERTSLIFASMPTLERSM